MQLSDLELQEVRNMPVYKPGFNGKPAAPKVGDDSIGWKQCRAVEASTKRLERTRLMRQVVHQGGHKRKVGTPPAHLKSIDFGSLVTYGRPTTAAKKHFKALIQVKKGVWNEKTSAR